LCASRIVPRAVTMPVNMEEGPLDLAAVDFQRIAAKLAAVR